MDTKFIKTTKERDYTIIDNTFIKDCRLSWKAKGLMTYLLSLPDDWSIHLSEVEKHATDGKSALRSAINELKELGYLKAEQQRENNRFAEMVYIIIENPDEDSLFTDFQQTENLNSENLHTENQTLQNTNNKKILKEQNTNNIPKQKKHKNGTFQNVLLTDDELQKLIERLGEEKAKAVIDNFSERKEMKGYKYKSDYLAIIKWGIIAFEKKQNTNSNKIIPDFVKTVFQMITEHNDKQTEAKRKMAVSKDVATFCEKEGEMLMEISESRTQQEIISALKNYLYVANMKNTWVNMFTFNAFCKGLDKYLPDYFDYEAFADYRIDYDHTTDPDLIFVNKMENEPDFNQYLFDKHVKEWVANGCPEGEEYYRLQETWR